MEKTKKSCIMAMSIIILILAFFIGALVANCSATYAESSGVSASATAYTRPSNLEEITKNDVPNTNAPSMTVLVHGLGGDEMAWSNELKEFAYDKDSLIESLAGDRSHTEVLLAKMKRSSGLSFELSRIQLNDGKYSTDLKIDSLSQEDTTKHIIVIFAESNNMQANGDAYKELNYVIDSLFYDLQTLGVTNPRINLIGHSRGGILNMEYAINHPYNVAGLFSIGTPYNGSTSYDLGAELLSISALKDSDIGKELDRTINSAGGKSIVDQDEINKRRKDWNGMIANSGIEAYAIGGAMSAPFLYNLIDYIDGLINIAGESTSILEESNDLMDIKDLNDLKDLYYNYKDYIQLFLGQKKAQEMEDMVKGLELIEKINNSLSIYEIVEIFYNDVTSNDSLLVKCFNIDKEMKKSIEDVKENLDDAKERYEENLKLYDKEFADNMANLELKDTLLKRYDINQVFNVDNLQVSIFSRLEDPILLFNDLGLEITNDDKIYDIEVRYLFGKNGINFQYICDYIKTTIDINIESGAGTTLDKYDFTKVKTIIKLILDAMPYVNATLEALVLTNPLLELLTISLISGLLIGDKIDDNELNNSITILAEPYSKILSEIKLKSHTNFKEHWYSFLEFWKDELVWLNDGLVDLNSQLAFEYDGFKRISKLFEVDNADMFKLAQPELPIPIVHNLETRDKDIINYISQHIDLGIADVDYFNYRKVSSTEIFITGIKHKYELSPTILIPETIKGFLVVGIADNAFPSERFAEVEEVILPNTITYIGKKAFAHFKSLTKINLPESLTKVGEYAFADCKLETIELPIGLNEISTGMFFNNELTIENVPKNVTKIGEMAFFGCKMSRFEIHKDITEIGEGAFANCSNLTLIYVDKENRHFKFYNDALYDYEGGLLLQFFGKNHNSYVIDSTTYRVGAYSFYNSSLSSITIEDGLEYIGGYAFANNSSLSSVVLKSSIIEIGGQAFANCENLAKVIILCEIVPNMGWDIFDNVSNGCQICVPGYLIDDYASTNFLKRYKDSIVAIKSRIDFNSNNGSTCKSIEVEYGSEIEFPISIRNGYTFIGWSYEQDGGVEDIITQSVWKQYKDTILYAVWQIETYTINYWYNHPADNNYSINNPLSYTVESVVRLNSPSCDGYEFNGWYDNDKFEGSPVANIYKGTYGDKVFYAKWTPKKYQINLELNSTEADISTTQTELTFDQVVDIPTPTREGYYFDGWYLDAECNGVGYFTNQSIWDIAQDITLYAKWTKEKYEVKVSVYDADTSLMLLKWWDGNGVKDEKVFIEYGMEVSFYEYFRNYFNSVGYREGYDCFSFSATTSTFDNGNWSRVPDLGENNAVIVVTPQWQIERHTINFSGGGGQIEFTKDEGEYGVAIHYPRVSREGYNFTEWKVTYAPFITSSQSPFSVGKIFNYSVYPDLTPKYYSSTCLGSGNITLTAQWEAKKFEIVFNSNGGSACSNMSGVAYGSKLSGMPTSTKKGYALAGWYAESDLSGNNYGNGSIWDQDIEGVSAPSITLYAKWTPTVYSITFNTDGGSGVAKRNYTIEDAFDLPTCTKNGLNNRGWINLANNNVITRIEKGTTENLVLKARWPETESVGTNQTRTITKVLSIMDFRDLPTNVDSVYTFSTDVQEVILRGTTSKEFKNLRFEIEKERETPITITLWDFKFQAQDDCNAIYAKDSDIAIAVRINSTSGMEMSGSCQLNLICKGDSIIRGGTRLTYNIMYTGSPEHYCSGIVCHSINIQQEGTSTLKIYGGNGIDGNVNNPVGPGDIAAIAGRHGGSAVWASYVYINVSRLEVYGGNGGNGAQGKQGDAMTETAAQGNTGHQGGTGGSGRYAFNVARAIKIASWAQVYARGGDGGNGGKGGKGGTGGPGKNNAWGTGGKGGKGGTGGRGGTKGQGYDAKSGMATITGSFTQLVNGSNGTGGPGGDGGNGGQGGKSYSGVGKPGPTGDPGDTGKEGR